MDLDLWDCFGRKKTPSYNQRNMVVGFVMLRLIFSLNRLRATPLMMMCMVARKRQLKWMFIESLKKVKNFCCCFFVKLRQSFERQFRVATVKEKHLEDVLFFFCQVREESGNFVVGQGNLEGT